MNQSRRAFVKTSGLALASMGPAPSFLTKTARTAPRTARSSARTLICVFQRGALDGLSLLVPFRDPDYYRLRDRTAIPPPGRRRGAIDLDGQFGLHPALESLYPLYVDGTLAPIHAVGSPHSTRSHLDAQHYMETGSPGQKANRDGWINRYLAHGRRASAPISGVAMGRTLPRALRGGATAGIVAASSPEASEAVRLLREAEAHTVTGAVVYPKTAFGESMRQFAQLIKMDVGLEIGFVDVAGWDTHANQGGSQGELAHNLLSFALALSAFVADLGDLMNNVVVLTMSEFGRTVAENGTGGTDHGHATAMLVLGGNTAGGQVHGRWPTLEAGLRYEGRDLAVTTDFRDLFAEVLVRHLGATELSTVFPGHQHDVNNWPGVMRV